ncbi:hypothetical protein DFH11DRAFT_1755118 [Phellopilus nigrolimitatus]|nr:hypothetical protein DFH11DRAFT_1755118 [Phellopilus nigrolimitatus]
MAYKPTWLAWILALRFLFSPFHSAKQRDDVVNNSHERTPQGPRRTKLSLQETASPSLGNPGTPDGDKVSTGSQDEGEENRKSRRKLTMPQRRALEDLEARDSNPPLETRRLLALELGLELKVVSVWFQNRRRPTYKSRQNTQEAELGRREVLRDASVSTGGINTHGDSDGFPPMSAMHAHDRSLSSLWNLIPSSSPEPQSATYLSDSSLPDPTFAHDMPPKAKRRLSLEWACENDGHTAKRARRSLPRDIQRKTPTMPYVLPNSSRRKRTDVKPHKPSPSLFQSIARPGGSLVRQSYVKDFYGTDDKDIFEVAIALVQLKEQGPTKAFRLSL